MYKPSLLYLAFKYIQTVRTSPLTAYACLQSASGVRWQQCVAQIVMMWWTMWVILIKWKMAH